MRLLLDTRTLIWWLAGDPSLSSGAKAATGDPDNEVFVSGASAWEIATKYRIGRLPQAAALALDVSGARGPGLRRASDHRAARSDGWQPAGSHRDPFDRMLIAQAALADLILVSNEVAFDRYAVRRLW